MQTVQIKLRVPPDDAKFLDDLAGQLFSRNDMATMLLHAAVNAVRDNPDALKFPPTLIVTEPPSGNALNDSPRKKK